MSYMSDMAATDRYSRLVFRLKVALPLAALAILSTLFFVAESLDPDAAIPYAEVDVARILEEQGVSNASLGGVTSDGVAISLAARKIRADASQTVLMGETLTAVLNMPDGSRIDIVSPSGTVDSNTQEVTLDGGVRLESTNGYVVTTDRLVTSLRHASAASEGKIVATGPAGEISAGSMMLVRPDSDGGHQLVFQDGVRMVYHP